MKGGINIRQNMLEYNQKTSMFLKYFPSYFHHPENDDAQLYFLADQMVELNFDPNAIITIQGEKSLYSYIIGEGKVNLKHSYSEQRQLTVKDYYLEMKELKETQKNESLMKTIELNSKILPINNLSDLDELDTITYHVTLYNKVLNREDPVKILSFLSQYNFYEAKKYADDLREAIEKSLLEIKKWRTKVEEQFNHEKYAAYLPLAKNEIHKLNFACVEIISQLQPGDIISKEGYDMIKGTIVYSAVVAEEKCIVYKMTARILNGLFRKDQDKRFKDIYSFFKNIFLFKSLGDTNQLKHYALKSTIKSYKKGTIIHEENDVVNTIYILQEGRIEVKLKNMTLFNLRAKIQQLIQILNNIPENENEERKYELLNNEDDEDEMITKKKLKDIQLNTISLFLVDSYEIFALIEQYFDLPISLVTVEVVSMTANLLTIPRTTLYKCILEKQYITKPIAYNKLDNLIQRLMTLYKNHTHFHDKKIELKQFYDLPQQKKVKNKKTKILLTKSTIVSATISRYFGLLPKIKGIIQQSQKKNESRINNQISEPSKLPIYTPKLTATPTQETISTTDRYNDIKKPSPRNASSFLQKITIPTHEAQSMNDPIVVEEIQYKKIKNVLNSYAMISKGTKSFARNHGNKNDLKSLCLTEFDSNNSIYNCSKRGRNVPIKQSKKQSITLQLLNNQTNYYNKNNSVCSEISLKPNICNFGKNAINI